MRYLVEKAGVPVREGRVRNEAIAAIQARDGETVWTIHGSGPVPSGATVADGVLVGAPGLEIEAL